MELRILGCNGPYPMPGGACSGYLVTEGSECLVLDMGPGVMSRLLRYTDPAALKGICLSHWHWDHCSDLGVLCYSLQGLAAKAGYRPLPLYFPQDDSAPMAAFVAATGLFALHPIKAGDSFSLGDTAVSVGPARHPAPGVSYRLEGKSGNSLFYTGDTNEAQGLADFAKGAKTMLACGCLPDGRWSDMAPHLSARLAARLALEAGAESLVLTHLRPDVDTKSLLEEAREVFPKVSLAEGERRISLP